MDNFTAWLEVAQWALLGLAFWQLAKLERSNAEAWDVLTSHNDRTLKLENAAKGQDEVNFSVGREVGSLWRVSSKQAERVSALEASVKAERQALTSSLAAKTHLTAPPVVRTFKVGADGRAQEAQPDGRQPQVLP